MPTARRISTRPVARSWSTSATAGGTIAEAMAAQAGAVAYAHGSAFTSEPLEAYAAEVGPHLPVDDPAIYPVSGGSEAIETAAEAGPRLPPRPGRLGPPDRLRPMGELPRQHARRARPLRRGLRSAAHTRVARTVPAPERGLSVSSRRAACSCARRRGRAGRRARSRDPGGRSGERRRVRRRAHRRRDPGRGRAASRATGRRSPTSAGAMASSSSPTRS